jgi:pyrroloquinoline quinone biosynthesis protein D
MTISEEVVPRLPHGVRLKEDKVRGRWVLLAPERVLEPDSIAVEIIKRCDGSRTLAAVIDDLATAFAADRGVVASDVKSILAFLSERRMVDL